MTNNSKTIDKPIRLKTSQDNDLPGTLVPKPINLRQGILPIAVTKSVEIDSVGMGVLADGTPFLSGRGLARLCGVSNSVIVEIGNEWKDEPQKPRIVAIKNTLEERGVRLDSPYVIAKEKGNDIYVYPDVISLAILEYYAFEAGANCREQARKNYRILAGKALREFIYTQVGYDPTNSVPDAWKQFHDRVSLTYNSVPRGHFGVFKEISDLVVTLGQSGLHIDETFVPDISIGQAWSRHWEENGLSEYYGERQRWNHNYPDYFAQAASNPQPAWAYPEVALGEFRKWLRETYVKGGKFARYLNTKVKKGELPPSFTALALSAYEGDELSGN